METESDVTEQSIETDSLPQRLARGDPEAPALFVERHYADLYRYARALMRDGFAAEDVVQEAFARAFAALGQYPAHRIESLALRPWLYRITLNVMRNIWRGGWRETSDNRDDRVDDRESLVRGTGMGNGMTDESWLDVIDALNHLSEKQRVAVALRYILDLPYREIAEATGWPENSCKTLVRRGVAKLGELLSDASHESRGR